MKIKKIFQILRFCNFFEFLSVSESVLKPYFTRKQWSWLFHAQILSKLRKYWHKAADDATLLSENAVPSRNVGQVKGKKQLHEYRLKRKQYVFFERVKANNFDPLHSYFRWCSTRPVFCISSSFYFYFTKNDIYIRIYSIEFFSISMPCLSLSPTNNILLMLMLSKALHCYQYL